METIVIVVHLLVAFAIVGLILMQQGKGAEAGASFGGGGASQTVFGSQGGSNFFAKATAVLAFIFFVSSFSLAIIAKNNTSITVDSGITITNEQPAAVIEENGLPEAVTTPQNSESTLPDAVQDAAPAVNTLPEPVQ